MRRPEVPRLRRALVALVGAIPLAVACAPEAPLPDPLRLQVVDRDLSAESIERAGRAITVRVRNVGCDRVGTGSGVVLGPDVIATNRHVVEGAQRLEVTTWDGQTFPVEVVTVASEADLALARVTGLDTPGAVPAARAALAGDRVFAIGYPGGRSITTTSGLIEGEVGRSEAAVLRFTAEVRPGNSGGPLLNRRGELVGVVYAVELLSGRGLAVPAAELAALAASNESWGTGSRACR